MQVFAILMRSSMSGRFPRIIISRRLRLRQDFDVDPSAFRLCCSSTISDIVMLDLRFVWMDCQTNVCFLEVAIYEHRLDLWQRSYYYNDIVRIFWILDDVVFIGFVYLVSKLGADICLFLARTYAWSFDCASSSFLWMRELNILLNSLYSSYTIHIGW